MPFSHAGHAMRPLAPSRFRAASPAPRAFAAAATGHDHFSPSPLNLLDHWHLRGRGPGGLVHYDDAQLSQENHRRSILSWKALPDATRDATSCPRPRLISFEPMPTFTLGRRQDSLDPAQDARMRKTLHLDLPRIPCQNFNPVVRKSLRGGLATYHGPGQLVLWPVLDMHSPLHAKLGVASYASLLQATTQRLLADRFGIPTSTLTHEPGVWVAAETSLPRKIAALGVHHRRHVTALGIAINIDIAVDGGETVNPWARFVPCGLEGKAVTSVAREALDRLPETIDLGSIAHLWATLFEKGLMSYDASKKNHQ